MTMRIAKSGKDHDLLTYVPVAQAKETLLKRLVRIPWRLFLRFNSLGWENQLLVIAIVAFLAFMAVTCLPDAWIQKIPVPESWVDFVAKG